MSKSYFERRIFGEGENANANQEDAPTLGSLKSESLTAPSQPYRFGASRKAIRPAITAPKPDPAQAQPEFESPDFGWEASSELRSRLGMSAEAPTEEEAAAPVWDAQTAAPEEIQHHVDEQERLMDDLTGYQSSEEPYPLSAPQPSVATEHSEPSFGFHGSSQLETPQYAQPSTPSFQAAPVATTATHAVSPAAAPESAVTEPRMASASAVRAGERVNLSDQRAGPSVQPNHYVATEGQAAEQRPAGPLGPAGRKTATNPVTGNPLAGNPLSGASARREQPKRKPAPIRTERRGSSALPSRPPKRDRRRGGGAFMFIRNGMMAVVMLLGLGLLMSVSYAAFKGLGSSPNEDVAVLLAPEGPVKLRPDEAGIDPNVASGRTFETDLSVLTNPRGVLEPSDDRYASDAGDAPTMTMNFGGQALIVPQIDSTPAPVTLEPITQVAASAPADSAAPALTSAPATVTEVLAEPAPDIEEPLADASPVANGLIDLIPKTRGSVPLGYEGFTPRTIQASAEVTTMTPTLLSANATTTVSAQTVQLSGQSTAGTQTASIDPASGLPTTPQAPQLSGAAVIAPYGIQLASLRTEQQARVRWERLQDKYPSLLGGLSSRVVKFDSTSRGIFYRLQAGPMPTKITAVDFCVKLKVAGQECFFVRG